MGMFETNFETKMFHEPIWRIDAVQRVYFSLKVSKSHDETAKKDCVYLANRPRGQRYFHVKPTWFSRAIWQIDEVVEWA